MDVYDAGPGRSAVMILSRHLSDATLAAFIDGRLTDRERAAAETHLASCDDCRSTLVASSRIIRATPPASKAAAARRWAIGAAAVAGIVLVAVLPRWPATGPAAPVERIAPDEVARLTTLAPQDDAVVRPDSLVFAWRREERASYRVTLTDESGATVWQATTTDSSIRFPSTAQLAAGRRFYWYVDALRADGSSTSSGPQSFRTGGP